MQPSIDINSYANPQQNNNLMNQLINFKANRWGPAIQQGNQGLNQGISNFNNNNIFAKLMGGMSNPQGVQQGSNMVQQGQGNDALQQLMGGMGGGAGASGGAGAGAGSGAGAAGAGLWSYLGMAAM